MTTYNCETLDLISTIATAFGSLITAVSLIYLFVTDYKKSKRISNLERVAEVLEKDLALKYQPHLWINGVQLRNADNKVNFDINNKREWCKLLDFRKISGDLILDEQNKHLPSELEPKFNEDIISDTTRRYIFTINNSTKHLNDVEYEIEIIYEDRLGKKYSSMIKGKGGKCSLSTPKIIL